MKKLLKFIIGLVLILVAILLAHPLWVGLVVCPVVSALAPKFIGVPAKLDSFSLNLYKGRVELGGLVIDNPEGCQQEKFVTIGHFCVDVEPLTVVSDPIVVEEISLNDLYVSLVTDPQGTYNVSTIAKAAKGSGKTAAPAEGAQPAAPKAEQPAAPAEKKPAPAEKKPAPKIIIDKLAIQHTLVQWQAIPLPLPSFTLTGIGRSNGGVEFEKAWQEIETKALDAMGPLAQGLKSMATGAQGSLGAGLKAVQDASQKLQDASKTLQDATQKLDEQTKKLGDATKSVSETTTKAVDSTKETLKNATKVLDTEKATKALDDGVKAFKSLF